MQTITANEATTLEQVTFYEAVTAATSPQEIADAIQVVADGYGLDLTAQPQDEKEQKAFTRHQEVRAQNIISGEISGGLHNLLAPKFFDQMLMGHEIAPRTERRETLKLAAIHQALTAA